MYGWELIKSWKCTLIFGDDRVNWYTILFNSRSKFVPRPLQNEWTGNVILGCDKTAFSDNWCIVLAWFPCPFQDVAIRSTQIIWSLHYNDVIMSAMASQITSLTVVYSIVYLRRRSKKTPKLRVAGLCVGNSPLTGEFQHKGPVTRKMFPFDDVTMVLSCIIL